MPRGRSTLRTFPALGIWTPSGCCCSSSSRTGRRRSPAKRITAAKWRAEAETSPGASRAIVKTKLLGSYLAVGWAGLAMPQEIPWKVLGDLLTQGIERTSKALEAIAPPPSPAAQIVSSASDERRIPLELIDPNPYQVRVELDGQKLQELVDNIRREGSLLQPILIRKVGDRYQSICGHRQTAAFRRLLEQAQTDEERARWKTIPAREIQNVT